MTGVNGAQGGGAVLEVLLGANVQFVVVGDPELQGVLRLVVSRHPTNLDALGTALARLGSTLRTTVPGDTESAAGGEAGAGAGGVRRIGDPLGTVSVTARGVDIDLMFGGPHRSLYAETLAGASDREIAGLHVKWADAPARVAPPGRGTGKVIGRRLLSLAEGLAHLLEREEEPPGGGSGSNN